MATVKTAISIDKPILEAAERLARRLRLSRSRLFAMAVQEFVERRHNEKLLLALDAAHADPPDAGEVRLRKAAMKSHRQLIEKHA